MQELISQVERIFQEQLSAIKVAIDSGSINDVTNHLQSIMKFYAQWLEIAKKLDSELKQLQVKGFFSTSQSKQLNQFGIDVHNIDDAIRELQDKVLDDEANLTLQQQKQEKYLILLHNKENIERELKEFEELRSQVEREDLSAKNDRLKQLKLDYAQQKVEFDEIEDAIKRQNQRLDDIKSGIQKASEQKRYNDGIIQLENELNQVLENYYVDYLRNRQHNIEIIKYRIEFTKRIVEQMCPEKKYNKLDDMLVALDEIYQDLKKVAQEQNDDSLSKSSNV